MLVVTGALHVVVAAVAARIFERSVFLVSSRCDHVHVESTIQALLLKILYSKQASYSLRARFWSRAWDKPPLHPQTCNPKPQTLKI